MVRLADRGNVAREGRLEAGNRGRSRGVRSDSGVWMSWEVCAHIVHSSAERHGVERRCGGWYMVAMHRGSDGGGERQRLAGQSL
jgi:hypothetical protein